MKRPGRPNTTGAPGVQQPGRRGGYRAAITYQGEVIHLGRFDTIEEAKRAAFLALGALVVPPSPGEPTN